MVKFINNKEKHNQVLFELGLLDDDDCYELFCIQEERFEISQELYEKYVIIKTRKVARAV